MITIDNLKKIFNSFELNIPSLRFEPSNIYAIVGGNGSGKTTLLESLLDLISLEKESSIKYRGQYHTEGEWKDYTTSFLGNRYLIDFLTAKEYFNFITKINKLKVNPINPIIEFSDILGEDIIDNYEKKLIREYSTGNQKKIGIIGTLITQPKIVILDEPFANVDSVSQKALVLRLKRLKKDQNILFIIASHDLNQIIEISDEIIVLEKGKIKEVTLSKDFLHACLV